VKNNQHHFGHINSGSELHIMMTTSSSTHAPDASFPVASTPHSKTPSLIGFDPLLAVEDCNPSGACGTGVWSGKEDYKEDPPVHPFLVPMSTASPKSIMAKPTLAKASTTGSVLLTTSHHRNKSPNPSGRMSGGQQQQQQRSPPRHQKTDSMEQLREIAKALAIDKPLVTTPQEEQLITSWGESSAGQQQQKKKIIHRRNNSGGKGSGGHRKSHSMGGDIVSLMMNNHEEGIVRTPPPRTVPNSPFATTTDKKSTVSPVRSSKVSSATSTPDAHHSHRKTPSFRTNKKKLSSGNTSPVEHALAVPTLTPLHGFLTPSDNLAMRSSEQEPSSHQIELPSCDDVLMHGRLCSIMNQYRLIDQNFDFTNLVGTTRMAMQGFVCSNTDGGTGGADDDSFAPASPMSVLGNCLIQEHTPIIQSLLECSSNDDVIVEGFFTDDKDGKGDAHNRVEVVIFNCQAKRQFIVVYRGTSDQQTKPIRTKQIRKDGRSSGPPGVALHPDQQNVQVFPPFRESYFSKDLETKVFGLLDSLSERYPFCDVVMAGHSFGGALATIGGLRYASSREMIRVSCHIFGSPKVGGKAWRQMVNSTPNLKVIRIEHGNDPYVNLPSENGGANPAKMVVGGHGGGSSTSGGYLHVGHTIVVTSPDSKANHSTGTATAYRFEKNKPIQKNFLGISIVPKKNDKKVASQHGMETYVRAMEQFARLGFTWVKNYHGEDGKGVTGSGNEKRHMV